MKKELIMLFDIFSKEEKNNETPLKIYIKNCNKYRGDDVFVTIWNDLDTDSFTGDTFAEMTYAYTRRTIAAFLYLQGHFNAEEIGYQQEVFQAFQHRTNASYDFQEATAAASIDFLIEYSTWFTKERIQSAVGAVIGGQVVDNKSMGIFHSADTIMNMVANIASQQG
ncbi:hypothetical protein [Neptuniibacter sp.]|uniref:hypothetical protein n=1 Tax=Neptuniibacter sp. TaxID=1962643 RepID=UPI0026116F6C|nr:hypothetical protein [Neptuniibacter sp.]MCP4596144.1 hypothetical protein [Neptuniibacter sp.]